MKAIVLLQYGDVDNFRLQELPDPAFKDDEVLLRIKACSFNPADYQIRRGGPETNVTKSMILGRDLSGIVEKTGNSVKRFKAGDEVMAYAGAMGSNGTNAEFISLPANVVGKKPCNLSFDQAAAIPVVGLTALQVIRQCRLKPKHHIFVIGGSGGVGTFFIKLARHFGIENLVTTYGSSSSEKHLKDLGLSQNQIINYRQPELVRKALDLNNGNHYDAVLDFVGGEIAEVGAEVLKINGTYADIPFLATHKAKEVLFNKSATVQNIAIYSRALQTNQKSRSHYCKDLNLLAALFEQEALSPLPIEIVGNFAIKTVQDAHRLLEKNAGKGKLIMSMGNLKANNTHSD